MVSRIGEISSLWCSGFVSPGDSIPYRLINPDTPCSFGGLTVIHRSSSSRACRVLSISIKCVNYFNIVRQ
jgi:hypothetical protein